MNDTTHFTPPSSSKSWFISFEGIEGAGKTFQISQTRDYLKTKKFRVLLFREPGGTPYGEQLRKAVLHTKRPLHPLAETFLFASCRVQLLHEVILKELAIKKTVVICDRYMDSTLVYQGEGRGIGMENILNIHRHPPLNITPHLTFFLDISHSTSLSRQDRRNQTRDYFESEDKEFYQRLIDGYHKVSRLFPRRIHTINGELNEEDVFLQIKKKIDQVLTP